MAITNFMRLSPEQCAAFYPAVRANAQRHLRAAETLKKSGDYANAIAHRILGSEEMIKALILFMEGKGMELRNIEVIKPLFRHHTPRHQVFKTLFTSLHVLHTIKAASQKTFGRALATLVKGALESYFNTGWWERAEKIKQNAFYADHQETFNDPATLTDQDYNAAHTYTRAMNERMADIIEYVSKMNAEELGWFKESFYTADFTELLDETIIDPRKKKKSKEDNADRKD